MIPTTFRYASTLLSKDGRNIYRPAIRAPAKALRIHSRFASTEALSSTKLYRSVLVGFGIGFGWSVGEYLIGFYLKAKKVVDNTKAAVQDAKTYIKDTKDEVKDIIKDTRGDHHETASKLVGLAKEKKEKWQARKDVRSDSEDENSG